MICTNKRKILNIVQRYNDNIFCTYTNQQLPQWESQIIKEWSFQHTITVLTPPLQYSQRGNGTLQYLLYWVHSASHKMYVWRVYIYIYIHIHTYIYIYTYTYIFGYEPLAGVQILREVPEK